jgi:hypothetical protein
VPTLVLGGKHHNKCPKRKFPALQHPAGNCAFQPEIFVLYSGDCQTRKIQPQSLRLVTSDGGKPAFPGHDSCMQHSSGSVSLLYVWSSLDNFGTFAASLMYISNVRRLEEYCDDILARFLCHCKLSSRNIQYLVVARDPVAYKLPVLSYVLEGFWR